MAPIKDNLPSTLEAGRWFVGEAKRRGIATTDSYARTETVKGRFGRQKTVTAAPIDGWRFRQHRLRPLADGKAIPENHLYHVVLSDGASESVRVDLMDRTRDAWGSFTVSGCRWFADAAVFLGLVERRIGKPWALSSAPMFAKTSQVGDNVG